MNRLIKGLIVVLLGAYVVSPMDICPGPVDDLIVLLLGLAAQKGAAIVRGR